MTAPLNRLLVAFSDWHSATEEPGVPVVAKVSIADNPAWTSHNWPLTAAQVEQLAGIVSVDSGIKTAHREATQPPTH